MLPKPREVTVNWLNYFRIIPSVFPTINFFEHLVDPKDMEVCWYIESLTNDRLRQEVGDIFLVKQEDRVSGQGSSVIMAAFTHIGRPSRFTDGTYGVFYAANSFETAIKETIYHREIFLAATQEDPGEISMRLYKGKVVKQMYDLRRDCYSALHDPTVYIASQRLGEQLKNQNAWGVVYPSVRDNEGECIAAFRPPAISIPKQTKHLGYIWDGKKIANVYEKKEVSFPTL